MAGTNPELMVELVSASASADACFAPPEATLQDLALPPEAMALSVARAKSPEIAGIPNANQLFEQPADGFVSALSVVLIPGEWREKRRLAVVMRPFGYLAHLGKARVAIVVPSRFETDFASIPPWARWLISPFGRHSEAAVVHDWLYALGPTRDRRRRKEADRIFRRALRDVGIGFLLRNIMYRAVRFGGARAFGRLQEVRFRELSTLKRVTPQPNLEPFQRTYAFKPAPAASRARV
ncbi:MAG: DUF1353 domain-containing protein [Pseudomonadota bacterium]